MTSPEDRIRIGVSSCLLGNKVRYDGNHRRDPYIADVLGRFFEFVPVCPEVECDMGVPREPIHLVGDPQNPRLVGRESGIDHTERMHTWATARLEALARRGLCGFIFKSKSPSSGMTRVKVHGEDGKVRRTGVGIFARRFMERFPLLPVEEESGLYDIERRENFIERVFIMHRLLHLIPTKRDLVLFHSRHKLLVMAHSVEHYRALDRLVAGSLPLDELLPRYTELLFAALKRKATVAKHARVLHRCLGYLKKNLTADERRELREIVERYRAGLVPLIVPVTLLEHYARKYRRHDLSDQYYLRPHPWELKLRYHA